MVRVLRSAERYETVQPGIVSRHCFSAGPYYDPDNLSFGACLGVDEHLLDPGAGFSEHAHRGVDIMTVVLSGALEHRSASDHRVLRAGESLVQHAGERIRHSEGNVSRTEPLRFVQITVLPGRARLEIVTASRCFDVGWLHVFVVAGCWQIEGEELVPGDSMRGYAPVRVHGAGELLVLQSAEPDSRG
jgi:mannose-6-phosphate isomerase-like protein (cupin superfamily)